MLVELINSLGHAIDEKTVRKNLRGPQETKELPLVAALGNQVVGLVGIHKMVTVHRPAPGRTNHDPGRRRGAQDQGIGRMLVEAAEASFRKAGCKLVEVTSNDRRTEAHAFYRHMGYERTSIRFAKTL